MELREQKTGVAYWRAFSGKNGVKRPWMKGFGGNGGLPPIVAIVAREVLVAHLCSLLWSVSSSSGYSPPHQITKLVMSHFVVEYAYLAYPRASSSKNARKRPPLL